MKSSVKVAGGILGVVALAVGSVYKIANVRRRGTLFMEEFADHLAEFVKENPGVIVDDGRAFKDYYKSFGHIDYWEYVSCGVIFNGYAKPSTIRLSYYRFFFVTNKPIIMKMLNGKRLGNVRLFETEEISDSFIKALKEHDCGVVLLWFSEKDESDVQKEYFRKNGIVVVDQSYSSSMEGEKKLSAAMLEDYTGHISTSIDDIRQMAYEAGLIGYEYD